MGLVQASTAFDWAGKKVEVGDVFEDDHILNVTFPASFAAVPADFAGGTITGNITLDAGTGVKIGTGTDQKLAFHNAAPVVQRAGAAQIAVVTTGSGLASYGYTQSQADAIVALLNELRAALVEKGIIKGGA